MLQHLLGNDGGATLHHEYGKRDVRLAFEAWNWPVVCSNAPDHREIRCPAQILNLNVALIQRVPERKYANCFVHQSVAFQTRFTHLLESTQSLAKDLRVIVDMKAAIWPCEGKVDFNFAKSLSPNSTYECYWRNKANIIFLWIKSVFLIKQKEFFNFCGNTRIFTSESNSTSTEGRRDGNENSIQPGHLFLSRAKQMAKTNPSSKFGHICWLW